LFLNCKYNSFDFIFQKCRVLLNFLLVITFLNFILMLRIKKAFKLRLFCFLFFVSKERNTVDCSVLCLVLKWSWKRFLRSTISPTSVIPHQTTTSTKLILPRKVNLFEQHSTINLTIDFAYLLENRKKIFTETCQAIDKIY